MNSSKRLYRDLKLINDEPLEGIEAMLIKEGDLYGWYAYINGPEQTSWEGGIFKLSLEFPDSYPSSPPKVKFVTPMFHPNVYTSGDICLDILQDKWSAIYNVSTILLSIQSLLNDPNCNSLANTEAGKLFLENKIEYTKRIQEIVKNSFKIIENDFEDEDEDEDEEEKEIVEEQEDLQENQNEMI